MNEEIKNALVMCLKAKFKDAKFYKDGEVKKYPNFYIRLINLLSERMTIEGLDLYKVGVYFRIEYRETADINTATQLNSKLDEVGFLMLECLRKIILKDSIYIPEITTNETIDGIRIVDGNFIAFIEYEETQTTELMENLIKNDTNLKE